VTRSRGTSGHRAAILRSETRYERYSRQMPLQTICATFEGRREPRVRRMSTKPSSRDRRSRGSRLVRLFRPQNCGAVAHALAETGRVEDDRKLSRFHNGFYLQGDRSTTYAERAADCKLARLRAARERGSMSVAASSSLINTSRGAGATHQSLRREERTALPAGFARNRGHPRGGAVSPVDSADTGW
jgi:hypothetical protein